MTYQGDFTLPTELLEKISASGLDGLPEFIRIVVNAAMQAGRQPIRCPRSACSGPAGDQACLSVAGLSDAG